METTIVREKTCCVCNAPIEGEAFRSGGRWFCARHHAALSHFRASAWKAAAATCGLTIIFVFLAALVGGFVPSDLRPLPRLFVSVVLAAIPAFIWLGAFWKFDSIEPEPKQNMISVFALGVLAAGAIGLPFAKMAGTESWIALVSNPFVSFAGSVLLGAVVQEYLKYACVRFSLYKSPEFDERSDGLVYAAAAGLGFAFARNVSWLSGQETFMIGSLAIPVAVETLSQACAAGISGWFLGEAKFSEKPFWWLPAGVFAAALVSGFNSLLLRRVSAFGLSHLPFAELVASLVFTVAVFAILFLLLKKAADKTMAEEKQEISFGEPEWIVAAMVLILVSGGFFLKTLDESRTVTFSQAGLSARIPAVWVFSGAKQGFNLQEGRAELLQAESLDSNSGIRFSVARIQGPADPAVIAARYYLERESANPLFKVVGVTAGLLGGHQASRYEVIYAGAEGPDGIPQLFSAWEWLVFSGDGYWFVESRSRSDLFPGLMPLFEKTIRSLVFGAKEAIK